MTMIKKTGKEILDHMRDPRLKELDHEAKFERAKKQYDKLQGMRSGVHSVHLFEHDGLEFPLRLISNKEDIQCRMAAADYVNQVEAHRRFPGLYERRLMVEILYHALSSCPEKVTDADCFMNKETLDGMTVDSLTALFNQWTSFNQDCNPQIETLNEEAVKELIAALKDKKKLLSDCTRAQLQRIAGVLLETLTILTDK